MGMHRYTVLGPYLVLPEANITVSTGTVLRCPKCADGKDRTGQFCHICGTALIAEEKKYTHALGLLSMDVEEDRWFQTEGMRVVLHNHKNPHTHHLDSDGYGEAIDTTKMDPQAAIDWFKADCAPIVAWLAEHGHPAPSFHYGVVTYIM